MTVYSVAGAKALVRQSPATANCVIMQSQNCFPEAKGACFHPKGHILSTDGNAYNPCQDLERSIIFHDLLFEPIIPWQSHSAMRRLLYLSSTNQLSLCSVVILLFSNMVLFHTLQALKAPSAFSNFYQGCNWHSSCCQTIQNFMCKKKTKTYQVGQRERQSV